MNLNFPNALVSPLIIPLNVIEQRFYDKPLIPKSGETLCGLVVNRVESIVPRILPIESNPAILVDCERVTITNCLISGFLGCIEII